VLIAWESLGRFFSPLSISFNEAILVAVVGLVVNLVSAWLLDAPHPDQEKAHGPADDATVVRRAHREHRDHNLRAAYFHVLADALTSVFAIVALLAGKYLGWLWMDPFVGILGSLIIARWAIGLLRDTSRVLLDGDVEPELAERLKQRIERHADNRITDLHLWRVGPHQLCAMISVVTHDPRPPEHYKRLIEDEIDLSHVT